MDCKLIVTNPAFIRLLGQDVFTSVSEMEGAYPPVGTEILVADPKGDFIATFRGVSVSSGKLEILYKDAYGNGRTGVDDVRGLVSPELLQQHIDTLDAATRARTLPRSTPNILRAEPEYDETYSAIKAEQFESTTGQDVGSEEDGSLDPRVGTLARVALKDAVAEAPHRYRLFIVKDRPSFHQEEGVVPDGEVLVVAWASKVASLEEEGQEITDANIAEVLVKQDEQGRIGADGKVFPLYLEGSLQGEEDRFFSRNHEERLEVYAKKYGTTPDAAEQHFRDGQKRLRDARRRAATAPVEVALRSVSAGFAVNSPMSLDAFIDKHSLTLPILRIGDGGKGEVLGRYYLTGTNADGQPVKMLTSPVSLLDKHGYDFLWQVVDRYINFDATEEERDFVESIFGTRKRKEGPYTLNGRLKYGEGFELDSEDAFKAAIAQNAMPALSNKRNGGTFTMYTATGYKAVDAQTFLYNYLETEGDLWTHNGVTVPYSANRYFYLDIQEPYVAASAQDVTSNAAISAVLLESLFGDGGATYDEVRASSDEAAMAYKAAFPGVFTHAFANSVTAERLRAGQRINPFPVRSELFFSMPVGGQVFTKAATVREDIRTYLKGGELFRTVGGMLQQYETNTGVIDNEAWLRSSERDVVWRDAEALLEWMTQEGITLEETGTDAETLPDAAFLLAANKWAAAREAGLIGYFSGMAKYPNPSWEYWKNQTEQPSVMTGAPRVPRASLRTGKSTDGKAYISADAWVDLQRSLGNSNPDLAVLNVNDRLTFDNLIAPKSLSLVSPEGPFPSEVVWEEVTSGGTSDEAGVEFIVVRPDGKNTTPEVYNSLVSNGVDVLLPEGNTVDFIPITSMYNLERDSSSIEDLLDAASAAPPRKILPQSNIAEYAVRVLGKNLATGLFSVKNSITFAEVDAVAERIGDEGFEITRLSTPKEFAISDSSAEEIVAGAKTITLRKPGIKNRSGLVEISGGVYDIQELGDMTFEMALQRTKLTKAQFKKAFFGTQPPVSSQADVQAFFDGVGTRKVFTIRKLAQRTSPPDVEQLMTC